MALSIRSLERERIYTTEEFMNLSLGPGYRYELVRGVIKEMSHPGEEHMLITDNLYGELRTYVRAHQLGRVLPPGSYELKIPGAVRDTVRSPDLTFLAQAKITGQRGAIKAAPELAVEVYSPNDRPADLIEKLEDYQFAGWNLVWVIYPPSATPKKKAGTVEVYRLQEQGLKPVQVLKNADLLVAEDVLSSFSMSVADLFNYGI